MTHLYTNLIYTSGDIRSERLLEMHKSRLISFIFSLIHENAFVALFVPNLSYDNSFIKKIICNLKNVIKQIAFKENV